MFDVNTLKDAQTTLSMTARHYDLWAQDIKNQNDHMVEYAKLMASEAQKLSHELSLFQFMTGRI